MVAKSKADFMHMKAENVIGMLYNKDKNNGNGGGDMEDKVVTEKYLDARLDGLESRTDVKLKDLEIGITAKMDARFDKVDAKFVNADDKETAKFDTFHAEMDGRFDKIDGRFEKVDERFAKVDERFDKVDKKFDAFHAEMDSRFDKVDKKFDAFHAEMDSRFDKVDEHFDKLDTKIDGNLKWMMSTMIAMGAAIIAAVVYL